jgi:hypothetical protein
MNFNNYSITKPCWLVITVITLFTVSCHRAGVRTETKSIPISFKPIANIGFTEVHRTLKNGLSFDNNGFQTEPGYKITFLTNDSASVYSPDKKAFINFYVFMEQDSIFNVARSYFKMQFMSKDSLKFQVLEVEGDTLHTRRSLVYMTFYSNDYIKAHRLDIASLNKPTRADTLFIQKKSAIANKNPDSAFSARQPVQLGSRSPLLTVNRNVEENDPLNPPDASDFYMDPEFNITIRKAYEDFSYSIAIFVDDKGKLYFDRSMDYVMPEFRVSTTKTLKAIIDGYLTAYLKVTPGSTLGVKHTSYIIVNVVGKKG